MNPASADAAELIATLCIAAPLTFAGLLVAIDPVKFLKLVNTFLGRPEAVFGITCIRPLGKIHFLDRTKRLIPRGREASSDAPVWPWLCWAWFS